MQTHGSSLLRVTAAAMASTQDCTSSGVRVTVARACAGSAAWRRFAIACPAAGFDAARLRASAWLLFAIFSRAFMYA